MSTTDQAALRSTVAVFATHSEAENAIRALEEQGVDLRQLSIVGKDYHTEENVVGYYNIGERMMYWGKTGAFWGGLWGMLFGSAFFWLPGLGPVLVAGPLAACIIAGLEGAVTVGSLGALGAALASIGVPTNSILQYEASVKAGSFLVIHHGSPREISLAKRQLDYVQASGPWDDEVVVSSNDQKQQVQELTAQRERVADQQDA